MVNAPSVKSPPAVGLAGCRYLLAVLLLVLLSSVPMLLLVVAGASALHRSPVDPGQVPAEASPFITYPPAARGAG